MGKFNELIKELHETVYICNTEDTPESWKRREEIEKELCELHYSKGRGGD